MRLEASDRVPDMLRALDGEEESVSPDRDEIGNYEAHHSPRCRDPTLYRPMINDVLWGADFRIARENPLAGRQVVRGMPDARP